MDRPGFRQLIRDMETGQVDTLVVWRLDRLGRTAKGLTSLFDDLIRWKVNLISLKDGLDLVTPSGRLMATILAGVAAYETEVRAERILAGQTAARMRGVHWGGSVRGRRIKVTVEQTVLHPAVEVRGPRNRSDCKGNRPLPSDDLPYSRRECNASTQSNRVTPAGKMVCRRSPV